MTLHKLAKKKGESMVPICLKSLWELIASHLSLLLHEELSFRALVNMA